MRGNLLRDHQSEASSNLGDELQQDGRPFVEDAAFGDEAGGFGHRLGEHASNGEVSALRCVRRSGPPAQCEDLDAGKGSFRIGQVLALARAMSAIERSMMTVETGSSTGSAASPNVPPAAPDAVASARCRNCEFARGEDGSVRNAILSAAPSPFEVAEAIAFEAKEGRA